MSWQSWRGMIVKRDQVAGQMGVGSEMNFLCALVHRCETTMDTLSDYFSPFSALGCFEDVEPLIWCLLHQGCSQHTLSSNVTWQMLSSIILSIKY